MCNVNDVCRKFPEMTKTMSTPVSKLDDVLFGNFTASPKLLNRTIQYFFSSHKNDFGPAVLGYNGIPAGLGEG